MRLAQLARKLALRPVDIVEFLAGNNIQIEEGSNTRLQDDYVVLVMEKFAPSSTAEVVEELANEKREEDLISPPEAIKPVSEVKKEVAGIESLTPESNTAEEKIEVIKAPKIELSGLKVLGKIELQETKKKEPPPPDLDVTSGEPPGQQSPKRPEREVRKPSNQKRERANQRPEKNPIAMQREREANEKQKLRLAKLQQEKEQRTRNYQKRVTAMGPVKRVKLVREEVMEMTAAELKETPKTFFGRLINWFKT